MKIKNTMNIIKMTQSIGSLNVINTYDTNISVKNLNETKDYDPFQLNNLLKEGNLSEKDIKEFNKFQESLKKILSENEFLELLSYDKANVISKIDQEKRENIINKIIEKLENSNLSFKDQIIAKLKLKTNQNKLFTEMNKSVNQFVKENKTSISNLNKELKKLKQVTTDESNNYKINIDEEIISSKKIFINLKEQKNLIEKFLKPQYNYDWIVALINGIDTAINIILLGVTAYTAGALIATMIFPWLSFITLTTAPIFVTITTVATTAKLLVTVAKLIFNEITSIQENIKPWFTNIQVDDNLNILDVSTNTKVIGKFKGLHSLISNKFFSLFSEVLGTISTAFSIATMKESAEQIVDDIIKLNEIVKEKNNLSYQISKIEEDISKSSKKFDWVVIDEKPQYGSYWNGGYGGENQIFKNTKTNEIFTLKELLSKTKYELHKIRLTKVYDKTKGWYIKTLPNKTKTDNLG